MADFLRSWIMNIIVIIIFIMFLDTIMPNNSIKRYINVIVGLLIIIVVTKPFTFIKDYTESFNSEFLEAAVYVEQSGSGVNSAEISRYQDQKALEIYENNLKSQIIKLIAKSYEPEYKNISVDLELEREFESKDFGTIKSIAVNLNKYKGEVIGVGRIHIDVNDSTEENKNVINKDKAEYNLNDNNIKFDIKNMISRAYGIGEQFISVNIQQY